MLKCSSAKTIFVHLRYNHFTSHNYVDEMTTTTTKKTLCSKPVVQHFYNLYLLPRESKGKYFCCEKEDNIETFIIFNENWCLCN